METSTAHKNQGSLVPVHARVHYDMHQCITRFAARLESQQQCCSSEGHEGGVSCRQGTCGATEGAIVQSASGVVEATVSAASSSWKIFCEIWREMRFEEVFLTARSHGRSPPCDETAAGYAQLLLAVGVRQIERNAHRSFASRLGSLYLLFSLYISQSTSPPTTAPVDETQWRAVRDLISEMRDRRHAEGFRAIHTLCSEGAFKHLKSSSIWSYDIEAMLAAEREADEIGVNLARERAQAGGCMQLVFQIQQSLADLEPAYEESKAAILSQRSLDLQMASPMLIDALDEVGERGDEHPDHRNDAALTLDEEGEAPRPATSCNLLPELSAGHATRQMMRMMAYNPRKRSRGNN